MIESSPKFSMSLLALDVALAHTGVCVYQVAPAHGFQFQLVGYNQFDTASGLDRDTRVRELLRLVKENITKHRINVVIAEEPAALFRIQQAKAVMDLSTACYGIVGWCYSMDMYIRLVTAKIWQSYMGCPPEKGVTKEWSLQKARNLLTYLKLNKKLHNKDHNAADAINIGMYAIMQWNSGRWELPSQFSLQG